MLNPRQKDILNSSFRRGITPATEVEAKADQWLWPWTKKGWSKRRKLAGYSWNPKGWRLGGTRTSRDGVAEHFIVQGSCLSSWQIHIPTGGVWWTTKTPRRLCCIWFFFFLPLTGMNGWWWNEPRLFRIFFLKVNSCRNYTRRCTLKDFWEFKEWD